jgi:monofunctional biosynthetic peptidoglycan transglycosylase
MKWIIALLLLFVGLPVLVIGTLRQAPPPVTAFMLQSEIKPVYYEWVPAERIAGVALKAVVAAEDQKFWRHRGFDFEAMEQAYRHNQKRRQRRGASTITQQTAKNLFLWPGGGYFRKGIEAYLTLLIEWLWPKERILEIYLNIAEFGPGIYGVEAAARKFFGKPAQALTPGEAARLAAVLPNPRRWSAAPPGPYVMTRSAWILRQMGYAPRPSTVPDPEPVEPDEPDEPDTGASGLPEDEGEPAEEYAPQELAPDSGDFPTGEEEPAEMPETGAPPEPAAPGSQEEGRPLEGGSVADEAPWDNGME